MIPLSTVDSSGHTFGHFVPYSAQRALDLKDGSGSSLSIPLLIYLRERDELYAAALAARLRREMPAFVERLAAEAHDAVFPGDAVVA